ncbi:MAG: beta-glucuronidase [Bacteroidaceae bacterium]|nr:beta-glucuronidase [Bacteroidaceae bacterium]
MKKLYFVFLICFCTLASYAQRSVIDLSGKWQFATDAEEKMTPSTPLTDVIELPGSMLQRAKGNKPSVKTVWTGSLYDSSYFFNPYMKKYQTEDNFKLPFFLTPGYHYVGVAWYKKTVTIPASFQGKRVVLYLERPHITTTLYVNHKEVGSQNSLSVAHEYDVTSFVTPGENAEICIKVDNDADKVGVGKDSHSVSDQTQGNWNGIVGKMELRALSKLEITHVDVFPEVKNHSLQIKVDFVNHNPTPIKGKAAKRIPSDQCYNLMCYTDCKTFDEVANKQSTDNGNTLSFTMKARKEVLTWDEFHPHLYHMNVVLSNQAGDRDTLRVTFGMRNIDTQGKDIVVNGRMTMMRGTVENCCFPLTGYPPTDKASWMSVFRKCKEYGLNHMRFHSYCPPEAAFEAADELGFYLQPEGPSWPNHGIKLGNGMMIDKYLMEETQRMVQQYGNHPSFAMLSCGNEPAGGWVKWVSQFVDYWRATDNRRIYTGASVGGSWAWQPKNQYHVKAGARGLASWLKSEPSSDDDFRANIDTVSQPFISHETGQWCAFPDFDEIAQYTGVYKARNFEIFRDILSDNGMADKARNFLLSSGKLQVLCYKYEMEKTLRTPHYAGFQLLGLNDYSGQGTALVGPLNVLWKEKGYVDSLYWREFCAPITVLARLPKFTYLSGEEIPYAIEVANYGENEITSTKARVQILDKDSNIVAQNLFGGDNIAMGGCQAIGTYTMTLDVTEPTQYIMQAELFGEVNGKDVSVVNHWNLWVYPRHSADEMKQLQGTIKNLYICEGAIDDKANKVLSKGGTVLVLAGEKLTYGRGISQQFTPVFWNTSWFKMKPPHTTGMYIEKEHPLFRYFPTDDFNDMQWWALMNRQPVMLMDKLPANLQPMVQPIDTWFLSRKLGMLFEAKIGKGRVLVSTMPYDVDSKYPTIVQMSYALLKYMASTDFAPTIEVTTDHINALFTEKTPNVDMFTNDSPDELKKNIK